MPEFKKYSFFILGLALFILLSYNIYLQADTLYLKSGRSIEGLIKKEDAEMVDLNIGFGSMKFFKSDIESIQKSSREDTALIKEKWEEDKFKEQDKMRQAQIRKERLPQSVEVDSQNGHIMVNAVIDRKVQANLLLDTGSSLVVLANSLANSLGIDSRPGRNDTMFMILADGRKVKVQRVVLGSVKVQGSEVRNVEAAILPADESTRNNFDGLLGMSFLRNFNFRVDQKNNNLILEKL